MRKIYFTPTQAESCVPEISKIMQKLQKLHGAIHFLNSLEVEHQDELDNFYASVTVNQKFHSLSTEFYAQIKTMIRKGYILKDLERGIVEFYAKHEDKEIFLSWKLGEKHVRYWHGLTATFRERKPISFLGSPFTEK